MKSSLRLVLLLLVLLVQLGLGQLTRTHGLATSKSGFAAAVTYGTAGDQAVSVAIADVNRDGKPDLVVSNFCGTVNNAKDNNCGSGGIGLLLGNGNGTFQPASDILSDGYLADSVAVADLNGDGNPDIVVANFYSCLTCGTGSIGVFFGKGDGTFEPEVLYSSGGAAAYSVVIADVNGDRKPDLVVSNAGILGVLLNNGDGTFQPAMTYDSGGDGAYAVTVADVNGDGISDILVANGCASPCVGGIGSVGVLFGNGNGTFQAPVTYASNGQNSYSIAVADLNGDGNPDIILANWCSAESCSYGSVSVLLNNGDGTFQTATTFTSGGYRAVSVTVADVNGDGKPDLLVANLCANMNCSPLGGVVGVLLGNGDGTFQPPAIYESGGTGAWSVALADVNGDGKPDISVANNQTPGSVGVLINTSPTAMTFRPSFFVK